MEQQKSMLVVKPDGVKKGLVSSIRTIIEEDGLEICREVTKRISPETAIALYRDVSNVSQRDYFPQLVEFMASGPIHVFFVKGEKAVERVRALIGKREPPSGIRAKWSENIIRNVVHGPHSVAAAQREMSLLLEGDGMKRVFLIGGMSESGKSTFGRYLDSNGIVRLKIVFFLKRIMEKEGATGEFFDWNEKNATERPEWLQRSFADEFLSWTAEQGIEYCCLESLYGPDLGLYMRERLPEAAVIVYVNMSQEIRLQRQIIREKLSSIEEAKAFLLPRDERKTAWRVPEIGDIADVVIDNSGSLEELQASADRMIEKYR